MSWWATSTNICFLKCCRQSGLAEVGLNRFSSLRLLLGLLSRFDLFIVDILKLG